MGCMHDTKLTLMVCYPCACAPMN
ncbi:hypothetical protein BRAO285_780006 [Bradyrhizobium sp. ORS 285]|nr:hypothetical protein BRAO285_780006 [Bradyrhizobium sp. ORS 285]